MVKQVKSTVYFEEELRNMISNGVDIFVEIGFSSVIKGFLKKIDSEKKVYEVYSVETLENFVNEMKKQSPNFLLNFYKTVNVNKYFKGVLWKIKLQL